MGLAGCTETGAPWPATALISVRSDASLIEVGTPTRVATHRLGLRLAHSASRGPTSGRRGGDGCDDGPRSGTLILLCLSGSAARWWNGLSPGHGRPDGRVPVGRAGADRRRASHRVASDLQEPTISSWRTGGRLSERPRPPERCSGRGESDLNRQVASVLRPVTLAVSNTLEIRLQAARRHSRLTVGCRDCLGSHHRTRAGISTDPATVVEGEIAAEVPGAAQASPAGQRSDAETFSRPRSTAAGSPPGCPGAGHGPDHGARERRHGTHGGGHRVGAVRAGSPTVVGPAGGSRPRWVAPLAVAFGARSWIRDRPARVGRRRQRQASTACQTPSHQVTLRTPSRGPQPGSWPITHRPAGR